MVRESAQAMACQTELSQEDVCSLMEQNTRLYKENDQVNRDIQVLITSYDKYKDESTDVQEELRQELRQAIAEMCCPQIDCDVKRLDAYMFKRFKSMGKEYGFVEQKVTEAVMRGHKLVGKHYYETCDIETRTLGPSFQDYDNILTQEEFVEFAS